MFLGRSGFGAAKDFQALRKKSGAEKHFQVLRKISGVANCRRWTVQSPKDLEVDPEVWGPVLVKNVSSESFVDLISIIIC